MKEKPDTAEKPDPERKREYKPRPSTRKYDREACSEAIFEAMADGKGLRTVTEADPSLPSAGVFLGWVLDDEALAKRYARARALCLDAMAEDILKISDTPEIGQKSVSKATGLEITEGDMVEHRRLRVDSRKWLMARLAPQKYGDRQAIEHSVSEDTAAILLAARKRSGG